MLKMPPAKMARAFTLRRSSRESPASVRLRSLVIHLHRFAGLTDRTTIVYLDMMEDYIEAARLPEDKRQRAIEAIDARYARESGGGFLLADVTAANARIVLINLRGIARLRAGGVALAIQRYRLASGKLPDTLADLIPAYLDAAPLDPFDGNEMRYEKLGPGFVVYSIDEDLRDDAGAERPPRSGRGDQSSSWDITFIVER
jgi:hypothetical protein